MKNFTNNHATAAHCLSNTSSARIDSAVCEPAYLYNFIRAHSPFVIFLKYTLKLILPIIKNLTIILIGGNKFLPSMACVIPFNVTTVACLCLLPHSSFMQRQNPAFPRALIKLRAASEIYFLQFPLRGNFLYWKVACIADFICSRVSPLKSTLSMCGLAKSPWLIRAPRISIFTIQSYFNFSIFMISLGCSYSLRI